MFSLLAYNRLVDSRPLIDSIKRRFADEQDNVTKIFSRFDGSVKVENEDVSEPLSDELELDCEMIDQTLGLCQPTERCMMQEPGKRHFSVCEWAGEEDDLVEKTTPTKLCCPPITASWDELKTRFETWLAKSKVDLFSVGLPLETDQTCGATINTLREDDDENDGDEDDDDEENFHEKRFEEESENSDSFEKEYENDLNEKAKRSKVRIVMGRTAKVGEIPWMVSIYFKQQFVCGGSIISERHILTAAHCFSGSKQVFVLNQKVKLNLPLSLGIHSTTQSVTVRCCCLTGPQHS